MKILYVTIALFFSSTTFAGKNIWRDCGIGALIFSETPWAAVTSNITWDLGITGSTTTTSSPSQCAGKGASVAKFIYQNYAQIEEETAKGSGEHLSAMLDIIQCDANEKNLIINNTRKLFQHDLEDRKNNSNERIKKSEFYFNNLMNVIDNTQNIKCHTS